VEQNPGAGHPIHDEKEIITMKIPSAIILRLLYSSSVILGGGSMALFVPFLYSGGFGIIVFDIGNGIKLVLNSLLCVQFFIQHSAMVRPKFRSALKEWIPVPYHGAIYATLSGISLIILMAFWQKSDLLVYTLHGAPRILVRSLFLGLGIPFYYCLKALDTFDALGISNLSRPDKDTAPIPPQSLAVRGPYRWVRHPIYLISIIAIWACPHVGADRILFNVLWTVWIVVGARLEEKDLVERFGKAYVDYQKRVPMIVPVRLRLG
jgi:protein-S-isoprenylcysteine O-methyltransferase Ste14